MIACMVIYILWVKLYLTTAIYRSHIGCFVDNKDRRVLPNHRFDSFSSMTNEKCAIHCCNFLEDATYSGTEYGQECYCGNMKDFSGSINETDCNYLCTGNASEICGGFDRIVISKLYCSVIQVATTAEYMTSTKVNTTTTASYDDLNAKITAIVNEIRVDKSQTGSYKRSKLSAPDDRKSVKYIGFGGILVIILPIVAVISSDLLNKFKSSIPKRSDNVKNSN